MVLLFQNILLDIHACYITIIMIIASFLLALLTHFKVNIHMHFMCFFVCVCVCVWLFVNKRCSSTCCVDVPQHAIAIFMSTCCVDVPQHAIAIFIMS